MLYVFTCRSGLMSKIRSFITSVLYFPTVLVKAMICRLMFDILTVSLSMRSSAPTPLLARASVTYPPTPPIPNTATRFSESFRMLSCPSNSSVLENLLSAISCLPPPSPLRYPLHRNALPGSSSGSSRSAPIPAYRLRAR